MASQAGTHQLAARDHAVLRRGEPRDSQVNRLNVTLVADPATGVTMCPASRLDVTRVAARGTGVTFCRHGPSEPHAWANSGQRLRIGAVPSQVLTLPRRRCSRSAGAVGFWDCAAPGRATLSPGVTGCASEAA